jgi:flavin-binding protein dodecin
MSITHVAEVVEIIGSSNTSWEDGARIALNEAAKTIRGITGIELTDMTARVDSSAGQITEYHSTIRLAFGVEHS